MDASINGEILVSLDIDGTMEFGEPPGPVTVAIVRRLLAAGIVVGSASDRTRGDQEDCWHTCDVAVAFVGGKHHLDEVRAGSRRLGTCTSATPMSTSTTRVCTASSS
jgi:hypothetical protein